MNNPSWEKIIIHRKKTFNFGIPVLIFICLFTPLAIIQFFCIFFILILLCSRFYSEYLIRNLHISRIDSELRVFRHEWVNVEIKIENHGRLPALMLVAGDLPGDIQVFRMSKVFCTLERRSWILFSWKGLCAERGVFKIGPAVIRGSDPLGIFPFHLTAKETTKLFVYPVFRSVLIKNSPGIPLGNMISTNPLYEDMTRCRSLRPYHKGDEPRRINWKASAHVSNGTQTQSACLLVNEYEATASYPVMIFLNADQKEYPVKIQRAYIERSIEAAAALCLKTSKERQELGIIIHTDGETSVILPSAFTLVSILERLAALNWRNHTGKPASVKEKIIRNSALVMLNHGKRLPYGTRYIYIGPDLGDEAYITLNSLKKHHLYLDYLIIDGRAMPALVPGNSKRYQMKENGYDII